MSTEKPRWLVVQCAALGWNLLEDSPTLGGFDFAPLTPPTPGVTCTAQAEFRTGTSASSHGMVANGLYHQALRKPLFWEQASTQVEGPRIWDEFRANGGTVGMMFWQQSLGEDVDVVFSPRPIHKHGGGMIQACYAKPEALGETLAKAVGRPFNLMHYWGPLASKKSSAWIVDATCALLADQKLCPDVLLTYLPHLDYDLQRFGPNHPKAKAALEELGGYIAKLKEAAEADGRELLLWGDYAITEVTGTAVFPNRALREEGLLGIQRVKQMAYPDLFASPAFAVVDHQVAHVHLSDEVHLEKTKEVLSTLDGVASVLQLSELPELNHPNAGDLILFAEEGRWFAYPWWTDPSEAPDFATHVDIHNKPGFDPCELFFGTFPWQVSTDTTKVGGTHGLASPAAWACSDPSFAPGNDQPSLKDLARALASKL